MILNAQSIYRVGEYNNFQAVTVTQYKQLYWYVLCINKSEYQCLWPKKKKAVEDFPIQPVIIHYEY